MVNATFQVFKRNNSTTKLYLTYESMSSTQSFKNKNNHKYKINTFFFRIVK